MFRTVQIYCTVRNLIITHLSHKKCPIYLAPLHAINLPLDEIRKHARNLDPNKTYISYCQTGRRSSAAAFILVQSGFKAVVLKGGTRAG
ncbi:MAG: hypothetical protein HOP06_11725 [Methylotenera sp.]|nr:hypothetical protein [Methylotenera sp.]